MTYCNHTTVLPGLDILSSFDYNHIYISTCPNYDADNQKFPFV